MLTYGWKRWHFKTLSKKKVQHKNRGKFLLVYARAYSTLSSTASWSTLNLSAMSFSLSGRLVFTIIKEKRDSPYWIVLEKSIWHKESKFRNDTRCFRNQWRWPFLLNNHIHQEAEQLLRKKRKRVTLMV